ncbi:MAG: (2Fe-2S)-binding protein, partial [Haloplanus sp.]
MDDSVRVTLTDGEESEAVRIRGTEDDVSVGGATFRFDVGSAAGTCDSDGATVADEGKGAEAGEKRRYVAPADAVPSEGTLRFEAITGRRRIDGILQRVADGVVAWENSC